MSHSWGCYVATVGLGYNESDKDFVELCPILILQFSQILIPKNFPLIIVHIKCKKNSTEKEDIIVSKNDSSSIEIDKMTKFWHSGKKLSKIFIFYIEKLACYFQFNLLLVVHF